jgi:hypothetical protein
MAQLVHGDIGKDLVSFQETVDLIAGFESEQPPKVGPVRCPCLYSSATSARRARSPSLAASRLAISSGICIVTFMACSFYAISAGTLYQSAARRNIFGRQLGISGRGKAIPRMAPQRAGVANVPAVEAAGGSGAPDR